MQPDTNSYNFESPKPQKWWQRMPKLAIISAGAVVLIVIIAIVVMNANSGDSSNNGDQSSVYYDRPGYDRSKLTDGIGDPAALVLQKNSTPVTYQGTKIVQACNVFDLDDIKEAGFLLDAHSLPIPFMRSFFDGQGTGALRTGEYDFALEPVYGNEGNNCQYNVLNGQEEPRLWIQVLQVPYSHPAALDKELQKYQAIGPIGGLQAYQSTSDDGVTTSTTTMLRSGTSAVRLDTDLKDPAKMQTVLQKIAANFNRLLAAPDGPAKVAYDSPLMPQGAVIACDILKPSDIKLIFSAEANPVVNEAAATAVGVITFSEGNSRNFISNECTRTAARGDEPTTNIRAITVNATTYRHENGAKEDAVFHKSKHKNVSATSPTVGDDSFFTQGLFGNENNLIVRKGAVILEFRTSAKDKTVNDLIPAAQAVVSRLP